MDSIHGHEVLNMMIESGEQYTHTSLEAAIKRALASGHDFTPVQRQI